MKGRKWLREAGIYALLFGLPFLLLFPYTSWRPDGKFEAKVRAEAVDFAVGPYKKSGPFVCRCADVSFGRDDYSKMTFGTVTIADQPVTLRHVDLQNVLAMKGTLVRVRWNDKSPSGVSLGLTYQEAAPGVPAAVIGFDAESSAEIAGLKGSGQVGVYPKDLDLQLSISPCGNRGALQAADGFPLASGSGIGFVTADGDSGILEGTNSLEVKNADRKETILRGQRLEIGGLEDRTKNDHSLISLEIKDGINVTVVGRAGKISIDGEDARPSLAEYFRADKILSVWLATSILIGSALLTVVTRIKLVKLDEK